MYAGKKYIIIIILLLLWDKCAVQMFPLYDDYELCCVLCVCVHIMARRAMSSGNWIIRALLMCENVDRLYVKATRLHINTITVRHTHARTHNDVHHFNSFFGEYSIFNEAQSKQSISDAYLFGALYSISPSAVVCHSSEIHHWSPAAQSTSHNKKRGHYDDEIICTIQLVMIQILSNNRAYTSVVNIFSALFVVIGVDNSPMELSLKYIAHKLLCKQHTEWSEIDKMADSFCALLLYGRVCACVSFEICRVPWIKLYCIVLMWRACIIFVVAHCTHTHTRQSRYISSMNNNLPPPAIAMRLYNCRYTYNILHVCWGYITRPMASCFN